MLLPLSATTYFPYYLSKLSDKVLWFSRGGPYLFNETHLAYLPI